MHFGLINSGSSMSGFSEGEDEDEYSPQLHHHPDEEDDDISSEDISPGVESFSAGVPASSLAALSLSPLLEEARSMSGSRASVRSPPTVPSEARHKTNLSSDSDVSEPGASYGASTGVGVEQGHSRGRTSNGGGGSENGELAMARREYELEQKEGYTTAASSYQAIAPASSPTSAYHPRHRAPLPPLSRSEQQTVLGLWLRGRENGNDMTPVIEHLRDTFHCSALDLEAFRIESELECHALDEHNFLAYYNELRQLLHNLAWRLVAPTPSAGRHGKIYRAVERTPSASSSSFAPSPCYAAVRVIDLSSVHVKSLSLDGALLDTKQDRFTTELQRWTTQKQQTRVRQTHLLTVYDASIVRHASNTLVVIVSEWMEHGSMNDLLAPLRSKASSVPSSSTSTSLIPERIIAYTLRSILLGLSELYARSSAEGDDSATIHHGSVKLSNMLISSAGVIKLSDRAFQYDLDRTLDKDGMAGVYYLPPESLTDSTPNRRAGDIWQIGLAAIEMIDGRTPHHQLTPLRALGMIPRAPTPMPKATQISAELKEFVNICCNKISKERPTTRQLLQHPFILSASGEQQLQTELLALISNKLSPLQ